MKIPTLPVGRLLDVHNGRYVQVRRVKLDNYHCEGCIFDSFSGCGRWREDDYEKYGHCSGDERKDKTDVMFVSGIKDKSEVSREVAKRAITIYCKARNKEEKL